MHSNLILIFIILFTFKHPKKKIKNKVCNTFIFWFSSFYFYFYNSVKTDNWYISKAPIHQPMSTRFFSVSGDYGNIAHWTAPYAYWFVQHSSRSQPLSPSPVTQVSKWGMLDLVSFHVKNKTIMPSRKIKWREKWTLEAFLQQLTMFLPQCYKQKKKCKPPPPAAASNVPTSPSHIMSNKWNESSTHKLKSPEI